jgi:hypothetical protein
LSRKIHIAAAYNPQSAGVKESERESLSNTKQGVEIALMFGNYS